MEIKPKIYRILKSIIFDIEKAWRQRNYTMIYSEKHGYGVEDKLSPNLKLQWFINHYDHIET